MANIVEFLVKVKDLASGQLGKLAASGGKSFSQLDKGVSKIHKSVGGLGSVATSTGRKLDRLGKTRTVSVNSSDVKRANTEVDKLGNKLNRLESKRGSGIGGLMPGGLNGLLAGYLTASGIGALFGKGMDMEQTKLSFTTMLGGSQDRSKALLGNLNQFSNATPFSNEEVIGSGRSLLAFGFDEKEILPSLKRVGDVASGLKIPFGELSEIYGKARVQGTLFAEDLNQLAGRGIPIFSELAKVLNVPQSEIKKLASESKITFPMMEQAFMNMTSKGGLFEDMMQKQSQTAGGKWSTLMGKASMMLTEFSEKLIPFVRRLIDMGTWLLDNTDKLAVLVGGLMAGVTAFYAISAATKAWTFATNLLAIATGRMTIAQLGLNVAMLANPVFLIAAGIAALVAGVIYCWNTFEGFRGFLYGLWESVKTIFSSIYDIISGALTMDPAQMARGLSQFTKIGESYAKGFSEGVENFKRDKGLLTMFQGPTGKLLGQDGKEIITDFTKLYPGALGGKSKGAADITKTAGPGFTPPPSAEATNKGITGGGVRNLTINLDKFFDDMHIHSASASDGIDQMEAKLMEMFLRVVNSANAAQG